MSEHLLGTEHVLAGLLPAPLTPDISLDGSLRCSRSHDSATVLVVGALLAAALAASLIAGRIRVPGLVLFLGLGMVVGSDVRLDPIRRLRRAHRSAWWRCR